MKIYTKTGDQGETKLFGGVVVPKHDPRVAAYGAIDELNAVLGTAIALDPDGELGLGDLIQVQSDLFTIGGLLAAADPDKALERQSIPEFPSERIGDLEDWIDALDSALPTLDSFILPGGSPAGARLHVARTVCRRAERAITPLLDRRPDLGATIIPYVNRLSDLLFTLARSVNALSGVKETCWEPMRRRRPD